MTATIESHASGDEWTVQFRSPIFGVFSIYGPVHRSKATGELTIGLAIVTTAGSKPSPRVTGIWPGRAGFMDLDGRDRDPRTVQHGSVVRAQVDSFGDVLIVVGYAIGQQRSDFLGVGHHLIRSPNGVSSSLQSINEIRSTTSVTGPQLVFAWADFDDTPPGLTTGL